MINHISFDFWDTLYVGNPNFRIARAAYMRSVYGFDSAQVHTAVTKTKNFWSQSYLKVADVLTVIFATT